MSLEHQLDLVLQRQQASGLDPEQRDRVDATVGKAAARRMSIGWTHEGQPFSGFVSVWLDGSQVFTLFGAAVGGGGASTDERFLALERFSAPVETALADAEKSLLRECPVFSADAVHMIGRKIPPASPAETYFKIGWSWAIKRQGQMDPARAAELRDLMGTVYERMGAAERTRFGAYTERVRGGASTTRDEDARSMRILGKATASLPADSVAKLRATIDTAITVGGLL